MAEDATQGQNDSDDDGADDGATDDDSTDDTDSADDDKGGDAGDDAPDFAGLKTQVDGITRALRGAATASDLEGVRRAAGHIPGLQRSIEELTTASNAPNADVQRLTAMVEALAEGLGDQLPDAVRERINAARTTADTQAAVEQAVSPLLKRLEALDDGSDAEDDVSEEASDAWKLATTDVKRYARRKGVDISGWSDEVWDRASTAAGGDPERSIDFLMEAVDRIAAGDNPGDRRSERKQNAGGGDPKERSGGGGGGRPKLTRENASKMTDVQMLEYPKEERDAFARSLR